MIYPVQKTASNYRYPKKRRSRITFSRHLPELNKKFSVILVTLSDDCNFKDEEIPFEKR